MLATQYEQAASLVSQFLKNSGDTLTLSQQLNLRGVHCFCLYCNRNYELARDTVIQLLQERERTGLLDLTYLREVRTLALVRCGLCDFDECTRLLNGVLQQLKRIEESSGDIAERILEVEQDIENTAKVMRDEAAEVFALQSVQLTGAFGTQTLGVADLELYKSQAALSCRVHRLAIIVRNFYQFDLHFEFSLDNHSPIQSWGGDSDNDNPIIFAFAFPRGAKVQHGEFILRVAPKEEPFLTSNVTLENHFFNVIHPDSYHPRSKVPLPICKSFCYIKADCSVFRSPIPREAHIKFNGTVEFAQPIGTCEEQTVIRKFWLLFPYGRVSLPTPRCDSAESEEFKLVKASIARAAFRKDQTGFRAGEHTIDAPGPEPVLGPESPLTELELKEKSVNLSDMDMLSIEAKLVPKKPIVATIRPLADIIPVGTFNYLPRLDARRDPNSEENSVFDLGKDEAPLSADGRRPLGTVFLDNYSAEPRSLKVSICSKPLGFRLEKTVQITPWQRVSVPIIPFLGQSPPVFREWQSSADLAQSIHECPILVTVLDQRGGELISSKLDVRALPPDFMVWTISEPSDGRLLDLRLLVARWVTPKAAAVIKLLEESNLSSPTGDPIEDLRRVYDRLRAVAIEYDMSKIAVGAEMEHRFQRLRTPSVTLASHKMNCVDGCILFASCMESLGYRPVIVFLPGHAIFGIIRSGPLNAVTGLLLLETTMASSYGTHVYYEALDAGRELFELNREYLVPNDAAKQPRRYSKAAFPLHSIVAVELARQHGITPFDEG